MTDGALKPQARRAAAALLLGGAAIGIGVAGRSREPASVGTNAVTAGAAEQAHPKPPRAKPESPPSAPLAEAIAVPPLNVVAAELVAQHFGEAAKTGSLEETDATYQASLAKLRMHAKDVVFELYDECRDAEGDDLKRFTAVKTLGDLVAPEAYDALVDVAREPLPPDEGQGHDHMNDPLHDERLLRLEAVNGLAKLAAAEFEPARQSLYDLAVDPHTTQRSLRMAAISGFIGSGPEAPTRAAALKPHLPEELRSAAVPTLSRAEAAAALKPAPLPE